MKPNKILKITIICAAILAGIISINYILLSSYAMYGGDDFAFAIIFGAKDRNFFEILVDLWKANQKSWLTVQGSYFSSLLFYLLNPVLGFGFVQLRIVSALNMILILAGTMGVVSIILKKASVDKGVWVILYTLIIGALTGFRVYKDIYFSYICQAAYSVPLAILLIVLFLLLRGNLSMKKTIGLCVSMFLVSGGILQLTGLGCMVMLLELLNEFFVNKVVNKKILSIFVVTLMGAIFNVLSPGNFTRHARYTEESSFILQIVKATINSIKAVWNETNWLLTQTPFIVFLLIAVFLGMVIKMELSNLKIHKLTLCLMILIPFVTIFPVVLGYASADNLPDRVTFVLDFVLIFMFVMAGFFAGGILKQKNWIKVDGNFIFIYMIVILIAGHSFANGYTLLNNNTWKTFKGLASGEVQRNYNQMVGIFDEIETSTEKDIVIKEYPDNPDYIISNPFSTVKEDWINNAAALWYGKDSLRLEPKSEAQK